MDSAVKIKEEIDDNDVKEGNLNELDDTEVKDQKPPREIEFIKCESTSKDDNQLELPKRGLTSEDDSLPIESEDQSTSKDDQHDLVKRGSTSEDDSLPMESEDQSTSKDDQEQLEVDDNASSSTSNVDFAEFVQKNASLLESKCLICNRPFLKRTNLISHMKVHAGVKEFECNICKKRFTLNSGLRRHVYGRHLHSGNLSCLICDKKFEDKQKFSDHIKTHTEKYECTVCHKVFTRLSLLNQHMRIHRGKIYECEICDAKYIRKFELNVHMKKHAGIRDKKCPVCNKTFLYGNSLYTHKKIHERDSLDKEKEAEFKCDICQKVYRFKSSLNKHLRQTNCKLLKSK